MKIFDFGCRASDLKLVLKVVVNDESALTRANGTIRTTALFSPVKTLI